MHVLPAPTATFDELNHLLPSYVPGIRSGYKGSMTFHGRGWWLGGCSSVNWPHGHMA